MKHHETFVVGGVDAHADSHHVAALDERGALLGSERFRTTTRGYRELFDWLSKFGKVDLVAVESTGSYAAGLTRYLRSQGVRVLEVNQPHAHTRRRLGKSDPIDAELAARAGLAGKASAIPKRTDGIVESIRQLRVARQGAVKARTAAMAQLKDLIITAPEPLREQLCEPKTIRGQASLCRRLRPAAGELEYPAQAARLALRSLARRIQTLDAEIAALDKQLERLVGRAAPRTTGLLGISTGHAGQLLVSAGQNIQRLRGEASFAALCGASPIPASSGKTSRHRLNYGGDRDANRALHLIAVCRLRYCPRTRAYAQRRTAEGKTKLEIIRCLKRYIARETYRTLTADLADLHPQRPRGTISINCGAGPIGITRHH
ncbi:MAG: IS110 family transposase, partial [Actinobacteria bacterium]|nr:IS110 family transposase [Actinomycetota bacterium]